MAEHPEWQANKADGTPFTQADLEKAAAECDYVDLADDEPPDLARLAKDEFDREVYVQSQIHQALHEVAPQLRVLQGEDAAKVMGWMHEDDCPARRHGNCNCRATP